MSVSVGRATVGVMVLSAAEREVAGRIARALLVALVMGALLATSSASVLAADLRIKPIKKALVRIERTLDRTRAHIDDAREKSLTLGAELREAEAGVAVAGGSSAAFMPGIQFASDVARVAELRSRKRRLDGVLRRARDQADELVRRREETIRDLEELVRRAQRGSSSPWRVGGSLVTYSADWEAVALCESSGNWHIDSQYDGGLQFHPVTWIEFGGGEFARYAYRATKLQQIAVAERVLAIQGPKAWPNCFSALPFHF
jgi:hypothetical protein